MDHLVANHNVAWRLDNLVSEVVDRGEHARHQTARDAPAVYVEIFPRVYFVGKMLARAKAASQALDELLPGGCHWRNPPVRRVDDQRCLAVRLLTFLPIRRWVDRDFASLVEYLIVRFLLPLRLSFSLLQLLVCQKRTSAEARRTLHRDVCNGRPLPLKIRITPRRFRRSPLFNGGRRFGLSNQRQLKGKECDDNQKSNV